MKKVVMQLVPGDLVSPNCFGDPDGYRFVYEKRNLESGPVRMWRPGELAIVLAVMWDQIYVMVNGGLGWVANDCLVTVACSPRRETTPSQKP